MRGVSTRVGQQPAISCRQRSQLPPRHSKPPTRTHARTHACMPARPPGGVEGFDQTAGQVQLAEGLLQLHSVGLAARGGQLVPHAAVLSKLLRHEEDAGDGAAAGADGDVLDGGHARGQCKGNGPA
jgi:hypothetical protein